MRSWKDTALNIVTFGVTLMAVAVVWTRLHRPMPEQPPMPKPTKVSDWREYARVGTRVGPLSAPITLTVFSDYQCPFCRAFSADVNAARVKWPNEIAVVYRQYPLSFHQHARQAAIAALCAGVQHRYQEFNDRLFAGQDSIGLKTWETFGRESGVPDLNALVACITSQNVQLVITRDSGDAKKLGVTGTPTFLFNNLRFEGSPGRDTLEAYIRRELNKSN